MVFGGEEIDLAHMPIRPPNMKLLVPSYFINSRAELISAATGITLYHKIYLAAIVNRISTEAPSSVPIFLIYLVMINSSNN